MLTYKRVISFLMALVLVVGMVPGQALAGEVETVPAETVLEETVSLETAAAETAAAETVEEMAPAIPETTEAPEETQLETLPEEPVQETVPETLPEEDVQAEYAQVVIPDAELPENGELYDAYLQRLFYGSNIAFFGISARERLTELEQKFYDYLKPEIEKIAAGERTSTRIEIRKDVLAQWGMTVSFDVSAGADTSAKATLVHNGIFDQVDQRNIINALMYDCPYDMYWYDKTVGTLISSGCSLSGDTGTVTRVMFNFRVAGDMQPAGYDAKNPTIDTSFVSTAQAAARNAQQMVEIYASYGDYEKLTAYKDEICALTGYDSAAASHSSYTTDADPWQLIYVFDGDSATKVVCEGYSKAFQYLFDLSTFQGDLESRIVVGALNGGGHMWNVVSIGGKNYMVDVTNSDSGTAGQNGGLFLSGGSGSVAGGYTFLGHLFTYSENTIALWGEENLRLEATDYTPEPTIIASGQCGESVTWVLDNEGTLTISGSGAMEDLNRPWWEDYHTLIKKVVVEDGVTRIGAYAFTLLENLTEVTVGKDVTVIGNMAFEGCSALAKVTMQYGVTDIRTCAFYRCKSLTEVSIPDSVTTIGTYAFYGCTGLTRVEFGKNVSSIESCAFQDCSALSTVRFRGSVPTIGEAAFSAVAVTANYPKDNRTWTTSAMQTISSDWTWEPVYYLHTHTEEILPAVAPDCVSTGLTEGKRCADCGETLTAQEEIPALGHTEVIDETKSPSCTETGLTEGKHCEVCNAVLVAQTVIPAKGHTPGPEATCTTNQSCTVCKIELAPAKGHTEVIDKAVAPTCTATGLTEGKHCSVCEAVLVVQEVVEATGHTEGEAVRENEIAPDCVNPGAYDSVIYCTVCEAAVRRETVTVEALGHTEVIDEAVAPTCTTTGLTEGKHCSVCDTVLVAQTVVPVKGHDMGAWTIISAPACLETGEERRDCGECDYFETRVVPATDHDFESAEVAPTCTDRGYTAHVCRNCGYEKNDSFVNPLGHTEVVDEAVAPDCVNTGLTEGKHCSVCDTVLVVQEVVEATGHTEGEAVKENEIAPDCVNPGTYDSVIYCAVCEAEVRRESVAVEALGHTEVIDKAVAPTCTATGLTEGKHCSVCDTVLVAQEVVEATGHAEGEAVKENEIAPDCVNPGTYDSVIYCAVCEAEARRESITEEALGHDYVLGICQRCGDTVAATYELFASKSLTLKVTNPDTGKAYTSKELTWALDEAFAPFATVTKAGKVTAKKVVEKTRIQVVGTVTATNEQIAYLIDIYPAVTQLEVKRNGEIVNGKTILMDFTEERLTLTADAFPVDTLANVTWTVSDKNGQYAEYAIDGAMLTISALKQKAGTVTIKATVDAGVKKTVTVKVNFGSFANTVEIETPEKTTLRGGESLTLRADTDPKDVTKPGVTWTSSDKTAATVSSTGKVTAKNVAHPTVVTITATSKDGQACATIDLEIIPKNEGQLVLMQNGAFVTNTTKALNVGDTYDITAAVITNGEPISVEANWTSSKAAVATVENGTITAVAAGAAKITAEYEGMKAALNIKVSTLVTDMTITTKDGKNLIEENGETMVQVSSGKSVTLVANILTQGAAKTVTWELTEGAEYAKLANGKLTANKDLTSVQYVTVKATAKDGSGTSATIRVKVVPLATGVQIYQNGTRVRSNTTYIHDLMTGDTIHLSAKVYPAKASQSLKLTSSNKKIADFVDGQLVCYKTGTVTITATAQDGSGVKTTFKLTIVKKVTELTLKEGATLTVVGGKSLKLAPLVQISPSDATNKKLTWSVAENDYGIKISSSGVLSTKKVTEPVTVNIMVTTNDGSGKMLSFNVTVLP